MATNLVPDCEVSRVDTGAKWLRALVSALPYPAAPRAEHEAYARDNGLFWLPCPRCGKMFGSHESGSGFTCLRNPAIVHWTCGCPFSRSDDASACERAHRLDGAEECQYCHSRVFAEGRCTRCARASAAAERAASTPRELTNVAINCCESPTAALDAVVMRYAPHLAGCPRDAATINAAVGAEFVRDGDAMTYEQARALRDLFEEKLARERAEHSLRVARRCALPWCGRQFVVAHDCLREYCTERCSDYDARRRAITANLSGFLARILERFPDHERMVRENDCRAPGMIAEVEWALGRADEESGALERQFRALTWAPR